MASIKGDTPPPRELTLAWLCGEHHLPEPGAIYNQEYKLMVRMNVLKNAYNAVSKLQGLEGEAINTNLTVSERVLLGDLQKMGIKIGGLS